MRPKADMEKLRTTRDASKRQRKERINVDIGQEAFTYLAGELVVYENRGALGRRETREEVEAVDRG